MGKPAIEIEVDDATGRWTVDTLPMILVPQHFFLNNHLAVEAALGPERLSEVLRPAGHRSAHYWCEREAAYHHLDGPAVFRHYLRRLSQRGWAQFSILSLEPGAGRAELRVDHSCFVDEARRRSGRKLCYMFASWFEGALDYVNSSAGERRPTVGREVHCAAEGEHDHCHFRVEPAASDAR